MSEKLYAWLLKLYPAQFCRDYGPSALQLFQDRLRAEHGRLRRLQLWLDIFLDLAISLPNEHWRRTPTEPKVAGSFCISEEGLATMTRYSVIVPAVFISFFVVLGLTIGWLGISRHVLLFVAYIPLAILAMEQFRSIGQFKRRWRSYQLILETDRLLQKQEGNDVAILKSEVVKINEDQYGLSVIGLRGHPSAIWGLIDYRQVRRYLSSIWIPASLTDYQQVKEQVSQWTDHKGLRRVGSKI